MPLDMPRRVIYYKSSPTSSSNDDGDHKPQEFPTIWKLRHTGAISQAESSVSPGAISPPTPSDVTTTDTEFTLLESSTTARAKAETRFILGISKFIEEGRSYGRGEDGVLASLKGKGIKGSGWSILWGLWKRRRKTTLSSCEEYEMEDARML